MSTPLSLQASMKKSSLVAERLLQAIESGRLKPGDKLPSERKLARTFQVSRNSVREALIALQVVGLLVSKPGDGTYIAEQESIRRLRDQVMTVLQESDNPFEALEERKILESGTAELAACNASNEDLQLIRSHLEAMHRAVADEDVDAYLEANLHFHRSIATASGNSLIAHHIELLLEVMKHRLWREMKESLLFSLELTENSYRIHDEIYEAIRARDPQRAARKMRQHFEEIEARLQDYF